MEVFFETLRDFYKEPYNYNTLGLPRPPEPGIDPLSAAERAAPPGRAPHGR